MKAVFENQFADPCVRRRLEAYGFEVFNEVLSQAECDALSIALSSLFRGRQFASRRTIGGVRNVLRACPRVADLAGSFKLLSLIGEITGERMFPVKAIFFDKTPEANWNVPWHQDLAIAVAERIETPGFGPWSVKDGVVHVQPPVHILENMVAVRLHLDDCRADNGALHVIPGSHRHGELAAAEIESWTERHKPVVCEISRGGALLMRPLLLHASLAARLPSHRRVLHLEYAASKLPNGLKWSD